MRSNLTFLRREMLPSGPTLEAPRDSGHRPLFPRIQPVLSTNSIICDILIRQSILARA
jgi:hypothetical protein